MRVHLCVVGRLRKGPEKDLIDDYLNRFNKSGRAFGLGPVSVLEVEDKKGGGMGPEADLIRRAIPKGALIAIMDERGSVMTSPEFAQKAKRLGRSWCFRFGNCDWWRGWH